MPIQKVSVAGLAPAGERLCRAWQQAGIEVCRTLPDAVPPAAAVMLDMPAEQCLPFLQRYIGRFAADTVFFDTAGVKAAVVAPCEAFCAAHGMHFVGAHVMVGSETQARRKAGHFGAFRFARSCKAQSLASPDQNKNPSKSLRPAVGLSFNAHHPMDDQFIITPTENTAPAALHTVQALAVAAGCPCVFTTPEEHDARIAYTEQLPQLLAAVYVQNEQAPMHRGFDGQACRAVASPAGQEISALQMLQNRDNLVQQLQQTEQRLALLQQMLQNAGPEQLAAFLRNGQSSFSQYFQ